ncbi:hypothetical protein WJX84_009241 [Apatococcus fuscideae]|uniref:RNA helicase n=1 Tax=Apatococcus fuscideae TaxID=2026836 RepID=A0AAW1SRP2_9CHLO
MGLKLTPQTTSVPDMKAQHRFPLPQPCRALAIYASNEVFKEASFQFYKFLRTKMTPELRGALAQLRPGAATNDQLFDLFVPYMFTYYNDELASYKVIVSTMDLRRPHLWYPRARAMKRRFIYHAGPTNSGKTYEALQAMNAAESGLYVGPLRLLAMEVFDETNSQGVYCDLITGQERKLVPGSSHSSCTVEMANLNKPVDVAIIDEIQMIGDEFRGWAWTRVLQGLPAQEIHLCGDASAIKLVEQLASEMGETVEIKRYERFTPLHVDHKGLIGGLQAVKAGDCIVAFSRRAIYTIKAVIEACTDHKVCIIYGGLPPETRRTQARLFNDPDSGYNILVASDAIGMGLNLNIRRIIFQTLHKFARGTEVSVGTSAIKQIAGRAGRRNSAYSQGLATCINRKEIPSLQEALEVAQDAMKTPHAGILPEWDQLERFAGQLPGQALPAVLTRFGAEARIDGTFFFCQQDGVIELAQLLERIEGLSLNDRYIFCLAPISRRNIQMVAALLHYAKRYSEQRAIALGLEAPAEAPTTVGGMAQLETLHQIVSLWLWLSFRFPEALFPDREHAFEVLETIVEQLDEGLRELSIPTAGRSNNPDAIARLSGFKSKEPTTRSIIELPDAVASNFLLEAAERLAAQRSQRSMRSH